ncbi:hypothetical protein IV49_GL000520 [Kandleria vitulina DSM 20405]|uniref:Uncharacterized protein n=1 Tax=Kandleria vitulina DSM 20405 TaxID=1410657 RepID=A0A0R2HKN6_9FIRM|nr:hypothetical protein IV49_GL000520 [Kandleria vitulina DSM 20405]
MLNWKTFFDKRRFYGYTCYIVNRINCLAAIIISDFIYYLFMAIAFDCSYRLRYRECF